ncbi:indole-3-glycerol phosphate synthase TrpC [Candidatus Cyanaurora vandensis]|uniref:indole-3-glycerol phosphate synthase TrpC n=1 Tax=Candidatus Cyanaurora vandensis TaxID=2714958 RepID=UPI00257A9518|nr:indole-3-glycerol phosphate synthase TrpC [Candidatus Cyanaurora vandensis]
MPIRRRPENAAIAVETLTFYLASGLDKPQNILEAIVWQKEAEVEYWREKFPLKDLKERVAHAPAPRDFMQALRESPLALIAEVKKSSPSQGILRDPFDPVALAQDYVAGGAACISVLTDRKFFGGSHEDLQAVRAAVSVPLLCKEFILHGYQLFMARAYGADAVLLIVALHTDQDLLYLHRIARSLGLTVLVEVHTLEELDRARQIPGLQLLGINNRNLEDFTVDLQTTVRLIDQRRTELAGILVVAESGIHTQQEVTTLKAQGCTAFLVGEQLVRAPDPCLAVRQLLGAV